MNVFVTGATGFIGSALVAELIGAGHRVTGLARNDTAAAKLASMGAQVHGGDLHDLDALRAGAAAADGVIHMAFIHDFSQVAASVEADQHALQAMADTVRPGGALINTAGTAIFAGPRLATEDQSPDPNSPTAYRLPSERMALASADRGVRAMVVRLPPSVYGSGDHGFVPALIDIARRTGMSCYVGSGENRWPSVHRLDAARLYRLALEHAPAGTMLHGVANEGVPMREIAEAIAAGLGVPARSLPAEQADAHFGWMSRFVRIDNPTSSAITRRLLNWTPTQRSLVAELRDGDYFS